MTQKLLSVEEPIELKVCISDSLVVCIFMPQFLTTQLEAAAHCAAHCFWLVHTGMPSMSSF
ncbi:hypothetical protein, partial [Xanthomonas vasicola]|uniref:hypothetical protein n=1 Tax=Xanthomonas vasicola TaxID=56459 RepID=UPI001C535418